MTDRTPAIIACMRDMVAERCDKSDDADLLVAHAALTIAVDQSRTFDLWPPTGTDEMYAAGLLKVICGETSWSTTADDDRPVAGAVARRLSEVACSLFVQGGIGTADWLFNAAGRLIGCSVNGPAKCTYEGRLSDALAEAMERRAEIEQLKALHTKKRIDLRDAIGLTYDNHDHAGLCKRVAEMRQEWDTMRRHASAGTLNALTNARTELAVAHELIARLRSEVEVGKQLHLDLVSMTEQRDEALRQLAELRREIGR